MKLIVLYGPENSGKTTTLKMVYEELKKKNHEETNCFKYYDSECGHHDFRDVIILERDYLKNTSGFATKKSITFTEYTMSDFATVFPHSTVISLSDPDKTDATTITFPSKISSIDSHIFAKVGFALEGDYGFEHFIEPITSHKRNLYKNLKELLSCDIVICACSILEAKNGKTPVDINMPENCLRKFITDNPATTFSLVETHKFPSYSKYPTNLIYENGYKDDILFNLSQMV